VTDYNTPASAAIGHNNPPRAPTPEEMLEHAREQIAAALDQLEPRLTQLLESQGKAKAETDEEAGKVSDLIGMFSSLGGRLARAHSDVKSPYLDAGRVVDGRAAAMRERIDEATKKLNVMLTGFQQQKAKRIREAREAERAAEAADPEPTLQTHAAVDAAQATVRGDMGSSAKLQSVITIEKVDVKKLPKSFLERPKVLAVIEAEAKVLLRAGTKVTGVTSGTAQQSRVRKGG